MRRLFALILVIGLCFSFASPAKAVEDNLQANLVRCSDSPAFIERAQNARNTTYDPQSGIKRFERYAQAMCGPEGLPHLIVDGRLDRIGDFTIPGILFLYIAGWIGWVGRAYIQAVKKSEGAAEMKEVVIDVPLAVPIMLSGFTWPLAAIKELLSGELTAKDEEVPISPR